MEIQRQNAVRSGSLDQIGNQPGGDGHPRAYPSGPAAHTHNMVAPL